jgi:surfeit locus 1 family protein
MLRRCLKAGLLAPFITCLVALAILLTLGTWQMNRKTWKEGLLAQRASTALKPPVEADLALLNASPPEFLRVRLTGAYLHDKERFWFADGPEGSGFHVFTPFEVHTGAPPTRRAYVWVNRGYIPARLREPATRLTGQFQGSTTLTGVIRFAGERNRFTPANDVAKNVWYWKDLPALHASAFADTVPLVPVMVDIDATPATPGGWPRGGTAQARLSNRHLEYALTWYALAATLIGVFLAFARTRLVRSANINVNGE